MRAWIVAVALLAACKGKGKSTEEEAAIAQVFVVPKVDVATVLAKDGKDVPALLIVDDKGAKLAAAPTWEAIDAKQLTITKTSIPIDVLDRHLRENYMMGRPAVDTVAYYREMGEGEMVEIKLDDLEDLSTRTGSGALDDPPPPEEEDKPDDGEEESGGTGTAMALEEGKMGKKDSDRAEGQYKMQKNQEDPQLARQQAIEQARAAGILGNGNGSRRARGGHPFHPGPRAMAEDDGTPSRAAEVEGVVMADGKLDRLRLMIVVAPTSKATRLVEVVRDTNGAIAVTHGGKVRPLRLQFDLRDGTENEPDHWLEVRVTAKGLTVEAVPDKPIEITDLKKLAATLQEVSKARGIEGEPPVDILVDGDVDAQRLIDVIVALDTAGTKRIGMGPKPTDKELSRRGHRIPVARAGQPNSQGDLDKADIRRVVKANLGKVKACYEKGLATNPTLAGVVQSQFFITPNGSVSSATASGVDPEVASCVGEVMKKLEFPKPKGGGGVQVNYPFIFKP